MEEDLSKNSETEPEIGAFSHSTFGGLSKPYSTCPKRHFMGILFPLQDTFFYKKRKMSKKNIIFCPKFFLPGWKVLIQRVQRNHLRKKNQKRPLLSHNFWTLTKETCTFGWNFTQACQNSILRVHENILRRLLSENSHFFQFVFAFWAKTFGCLSEPFRLVVKSAFDVSKKLFWGKFFNLG